MTTETREQTPAEARKAKATEQLQTVTAEHTRLLGQRAEAAAAVERLDTEIATAERTGDAKALDALRKERRDCRDVAEDIGRILPTVDRDLALAKGELRAATIACHADGYNAIAEQQRRLTEVIIEAIETISESIRVKEGLAKKQQEICIRDIDWPREQLTPAGVRLAYLEELTLRLQSANVQRSTYMLRGRDWSCQRMSDQGELLPAS